MMAEQFELWGDNDEDLERVSSRIARAILDYCRDHRQFHADDLRRAVARETGIAAPASADRILRHLRQKRIIDYRVVDRRASLYEVTHVPEAA